MPGTRRKAATSSTGGCAKKKSKTADAAGADEFGNIKAAFRCAECQAIREANPGGWISAGCHICGNPVWFRTGEARREYLHASPLWCSACEAVGHQMGCPAQYADE